MIYFIRDPMYQLVKIGFSERPAKRFCKIQSDSPGMAELLAVIEGDRAEEARLHERFRVLRQRGEWFRDEGELREFIAQLQPYQAPERARSGRKPEKPTTAFARWMRQADLTDIKLAEALGVSRPTVTKIRTGKRQPSLRLAVAITQMSGIPAHELLAA